MADIITWVTNNIWLLVALAGAYFAHSTGWIATLLQWLSKIYPPPGPTPTPTPVPEPSPLPLPPDVPPANPFIDAILQWLLSLLLPNQAKAVWADGPNAEINQRIVRQAGLATILNAMWSDPQCRPQIVAWIDAMRPVNSIQKASASQPPAPPVLVREG